MNWLVVYEYIYSTFDLKYFLKITGDNDSKEQTDSIKVDWNEKLSLELVILCSVFPVWIAKNDGGATPKNVPKTNGDNGTPITGAVKFMNQLGKKGVIRRNNM